MDGATTYHVTYSSDGKASWSLAALDHPADGNTTNGVTSITFDADNAKTYVVGVRAKNGAGGSGWRNSPASGPYTPPAPTPPAAVGAVTVTRADGTLTASWDAPAGAATYHVTYTDNGAQSWQLAALDHPAGGGSDESITFDADNGSTYIVGVRAKNGAGGSNWVNSPASGPFTPPTPDPTPDPTPEPTPDPTPTPEPAPPARPTGLTATGGDGSVTLSWDDPGDPSITGYEYRTRRAPPAPGWGPWTAIAGSGAGTTSHAFTGLTNGAEHRFKLRAVNALGSSPAAPSDAPWYVAATPAAAPVTLTADGVTATGATLTLGNWDGEWYYSASAASGGGASGASQTCSGPVNGQQTTVTGLAPDTSYTITAYANGCGGEAIAAGGVVTQSRTLTPSSPGLTSVTLTRAGFTGNWYYNFPELSNACFGPVSGDSVTYDGLASGTDYTVTAYSGQNCNFGTQAGASFSTTGPALRILERNANALTVAPHAGWSGDWYYQKRTDLRVDFAGCTGPVAGSLELTGLGTGQADMGVRMFGDAGCANLAAAAASKLPNSGLTVGFNSGGATFTIERWKNARWTLQQQSPTTGPCIPADAQTRSLSVTGLTPGAQYTFRAYPGDDCLGGIIGGTVTTFTVPVFSAEGGAVSAELTVGHWSGPWWYRETGVYNSRDELVPFGGPCRSVPANTPTAVATGLEGGQTYGFRAFTSWSACYHNANTSQGNWTLTGVLGVPVKVDTLARPALTVNRLTGGGARLTLRNWAAFDGDWYYRANVIVPYANSPLHGPDGCLGPVTGAAQTDLATLPPLSGLGAYHIFTVYSRSDCHYSKVTAHATLGGAYAAPSLSAGPIRDTGGTLTIANHPGTWYYKADAGPDAACRGPVHTGSAALTGLTANTTYTYTAYNDSGCANTLAAAGAFTTPELTAGSITVTGATLRLANHTGNWYYKADTGPDASCQGPVGTATETLTGLTGETSYTYEAYSDSGCAAASLLAAASAFTTLVPATLTASSVTTTTATLTIGNHTAEWYYEADKAPDNSCKGPVAANTSTKALTGLTAGTWYTYTAYSDDTCSTANELAAEAFSTAVTVSSIDTNSNSTVSIGRDNNQVQAGAQAFTTGPNGGGYTLTSITGSFSAPIGNPGNIAVKLYAASGANPGTEITTATLSGSNPTATGQYTYTCSGDGCALAANTTYFVVANTPDVPATGSHRYFWVITTLDSETKTPSSNGWTVADDGRSSPVANLSFWDTAGGTYQIIVAATPKPSLTASSVAATTATLTLTGHVGDWWLKKTSPTPAGTCTAGEADYSHALTTLTAGTSYTYKAYSDSACTTEIASATFTTP